MSGADSQQLMFISGDPRCRAAQEAIRVHVMRRQHRQRKQRKRTQGQTVSTPESDTLFDLWVPPQTTGRPQPTLPTPASSIDSADAANPDISAVEPNTSSPDEVFASAEFQRLAAVISNSAGRAEQEHGDSPESVLVHYYHQYGGGSRVSHEFYRAYCETTATYSAFLSMVATNYAQEKGKPAPVDPVELENLALREVADQLARSPTAPPSNTMLAVAMLANTRECSGEHDLVRCHWAALRRMILINGGIERLRMHQSLYAFLFWMEGVVLSGVKTSIGQTSDDDEETGRGSRSELLAFLETINRPNSASSEARRSTTTTSPHKLTAPITTTLSEPPCKSEPYSLAKWRHARLACLIFLAALTIATTTLPPQPSSNSPSPIPLSSTQTYLAIAHETQRRAARYTMYPEELYYILIQICNRDEHDLCGLTWRVARLGCAVKGLARRDWGTWMRVLCAFFAYEDPFAREEVCAEGRELAGRLRDGYGVDGA